MGMVLTFEFQWRNIRTFIMVMTCRNDSLVQASHMTLTARYGGCGSGQLDGEVYIVTAEHTANVGESTSHMQVCYARHSPWQPLTRMEVWRTYGR